MQYTQEQLTAIWQTCEKGNEPIDDPVDSLGILSVSILKNDLKVQAMMVKATSAPATYTDHDDALSENLPTTVFSRESTKENIWSNWCAEEIA